MLQKEIQEEYTLKNKQYNNHRNCKPTEIHLEKRFTQYQEYVYNDNTIHDILENKRIDVRSLYK